MRQQKKNNAKKKKQTANSPPPAPSELVKSEDSKEKPESIQKDVKNDQGVSAPARVPKQVLNWFRSKEKPAAIWIPVLLSAVSLIIAWTYSRYEKSQWESMQASNEEVRRNRELEYRAYVTVKTVRFVPRTDIPQFGDIIVTEFNSGRTPGTGKIVGTMSILAEPPADNAPLPQPEFQSTIVFAPLVDVNTPVGMFPVRQSTDTPLPASQQRQPERSRPDKAKPQAPVKEEGVNILEGKKIYIYGRIDYTDIFRKTRWTKFCFVNTPGTEAWSFCPTYNATDQQDSMSAH
jgi:hypothetical protein